VHVDVMDGHFVPNLSMGPVVVQALRPVTRLPLEVHLMIEEPQRYAESFLKAGADTVIFHLEVMPEPRPLLTNIRSGGKKAGVAIKPDQPIEALEPFLAEMDLALCMTVFPGFGGQAFIPESLPRIRQLRDMIEKRNPKCELEVDGGIETQTAAPAVAAGANVLVAGTAIFRSRLGIERAIHELQTRVSAE